ncbi:DUF58 domain-containing protein [Agaribacterium haliotis]|uniref:DUF58 domain-containing protein n=1 Tax=Agaribacterium haliotis TaxID=2013869 RepID=UPI000BB54F6A|nr:DUF58 domain-containing protein [Agaribacterium haliotis]
MRPSKRLLSILLCYLLALIALASWRLFSESPLLEHAFLACNLAALALALACVKDALASKDIKQLSISRPNFAGLAVGCDNNFIFTIKNRSRRDIQLKLTELAGIDIQLIKLPWNGLVKAGQLLQIEAGLRPLRRGSHVVGGPEALINSPLGLWQWRRRFAENELLRVYPNFTAVSHFELLAHGQDISQLGIHLNQRRGEGLDFHQLREFRPGDALRQVDWKATSRALKPIAREFQDERDQELIFLIDNGRRMRSKDGELSHFDHCLNALLLCAWVALRQGDAAGLLSFGSEQRWQSPLKGRANFNALMQQIYDLHSSTAASDYLHAAGELLKKQHKRSLIVLIANVEPGDNQDLLSAYELLQKQHLVVIACLREQSIDDIEQQRVEDFDQALLYCASAEFSAKRKNLLATLRNAGAVVIDERPSQLHIALVNCYLELKRSGRI